MGRSAEAVRSEDTRRAALSEEQQRVEEAKKRLPRLVNRTEHRAACRQGTNRGSVPRAITGRALGCGLLSSSSENPRTFSADVAEHLSEPLRARGVEPAGGLVEEKDARLVHHLERHRQTPALAAGYATHHLVANLGIGDLEQIHLRGRGRTLMQVTPPHGRRARTGSEASISKRSLCSEGGRASARTASARFRFCSQVIVRGRRRSAV